MIDNRSVSQISIASLIGVNKGVFSPMVFIGNHFLAFKGFAIVIFINTVPVKVNYLRKAILLIGNCTNISINSKFLSFLFDDFFVDIV